jgi:tetratricopeptide (TPR) repeat protein
LFFKKAAELCCVCTAEKRSFYKTFPRQKTKDMKLSFQFVALQLLSALIAGCVLVFAPGAALAQAPSAAGTDYVILKPVSATAQAQQLVNVLIVAVRGTKIAIKNAQGEIAYNLSQIQEVRKAAPPEFAQAQRFIESGELDKALPLMKGIADRYKGLPTQWATEATGTLGNIYISIGKLTEAEAAFNDFQRSYPESGSVATGVGKARLAAERGNFTEARDIATPLVAEALTKKTVTRAESQLYGQAYYILGKIAEGEGKLPEAMENYCRTVAIFYQERSVVKEAQNRIDELRKKGITTP